MSPRSISCLAYEAWANVAEMVRRYHYYEQGHYTIAPSFL